jgi:nicotinamide phosphoribosyltransferase
LQYPPDSKATFSYFESRGSDRDYKETVFFGLQYILKKYFAQPISMHEVEEARELITAHGEPFNYEGWKLLIERHGGVLPIRIRAVPEGKVVELHNALMTVETTDPDFYWLASYIETVLVRLWYPVTVSTQSYYLRKLIYKYLNDTADDPDAEIAFKLHDFGSRGVSSQESAMIGGASHLLSFMGTDTMVALLMLRDYYHEPMAGFSIPAGEHSTFSSWGKDHEVDAYRNMLKTFGREGSMLAVVSDTWDIYNACENIWGEQLRQEVIDSGATVIIRPDSGNPLDVVPKVLEILGKKFGTTPNSKGYKVLNNVRVIQGDGVNPNIIQGILHNMKRLGWSATNIAFGMGGALLQKVDRDTLKFAYKCSAIQIGNEWKDVYKDPITDSGKRSKKGRLDTVSVLGYPAATIKLADWEISHRDTIMRTVYENGKLLVDEDFKTIRQRLLTGRTNSVTMSV